MILIREAHQLKGQHEDDFEALVRDEWLPAVAKSSNARLLYYMHLVHGAGESYNVITYTYLKDGSALSQMMDRINSGDLKSLAEKLDSLRYDVEGKILIPLHWSQLQDYAIDEIPTEAIEHELTVYMEDTMWPHQGKLEEYVDRAGKQYAGEYDKNFPSKRRMLEVKAGFRPAFGSHLRREVILWQQVNDANGLMKLIMEDMDPAYKKPGLWMSDALELRDQWRSRLLRTASWSPCT